jgi:hypothetical protein
MTDLWDYVFLFLACDLSALGVMLLCYRNRAQLRRVEAAREAQEYLNRSRIIEQLINA